MRLRDNPDLWALALLSVILGAGPGIIEQAGFNGRTPRIVLAVEAPHSLRDTLAHKGNELLQRLCEHFERQESVSPCDRGLF